ncbi:unnamed protein product [Ceratitis capitata]|uniref:(Mediterranean fruit fly) hypothetical protein n=1 Tax=Ceratitis capitata TaxID=7213 RepID=A0A811UKN5_CERCA|nr:unnamed protein product [Ceratitis capitata]
MKHAVNIHNQYRCVSTYPLEDFNEPEVITLRPTEVESATAATERARTGNGDYLPLKREHWAVLCAAISLCFALATICKYMFWPNVRICGCKQVELQRNDNLSNRRELRPQSKSSYLVFNPKSRYKTLSFALPVNDSKESEASTIDQSKKSLIPNTPGVQAFKKDLTNQLLPSVLGEEDIENGEYTAQLSSAEVDLPCTNETVTIEVISSSFPLPERFFHAPKRCSQEEN